MYEAFARGDVPAILACLHEDVEREYGVISKNVPCSMALPIATCGTSSYAPPSLSLPTH
jgi:hypothetical protein